MDSSFNDYEHSLLETREKFVTGLAFRTISDPQVKPEILELFWIYYCAIGVGMTEPVEGWIRRSGERCAEMGWDELGQTLISDAKKETGHHLLMIADTKALVNRWNKTHQTQLEAHKFLAHPYPNSVSAYATLHEDSIAGQQPFTQIAIEFEIESLAVQYGSQLIQASQKILGEDFGKTLSFIQTHVTLDVDHSEEGKKKLSNFLSKYPDSLIPLTTIGKAALDIYRQFLDDCLESAQSYHRSISTEKALVSSL